jgi:DNA repair protein RadD
MLKVTYYGELSDAPITEYFPVLHDGYAGDKAREKVSSIATKAGIDSSTLNDLESSAEQMQQSLPPIAIKYRRDGKFFKVEQRIWAN